MPDVAVLDMNLKSETSFALAEPLQQAGVPFFFLSGNDASSLPENLKSCVILSKPVLMDDVARKIIVLINR